MCRPEDLERITREAIDQPEAARTIGEAARAFMNGYWHQSAVAERFAKLLVGGPIPEDWWVDPGSIRYWQGLGATDEHRRAVIKALVAACGIEALGLGAGQPVYTAIRDWGQA